MTFLNVRRLCWILSGPFQVIDKEAEVGVEKKAQLLVARRNVPENVALVTLTFEPIVLQPLRVPDIRAFSDVLEPLLTSGMENLSDPTKLSHCTVPVASVPLPVAFPAASHS